MLLIVPNAERAFVSVFATVCYLGLHLRRRIKSLSAKMHLVAAAPLLIIYYD